MNSDITISAYIIAGGKSTRFGQDKSLYEVEGKPLIQHTINKLTPIFSKISIIADDTGKFKFSGLKTYPDILPGLGPIGGLYTALKYSEEERIFICACDMPHLNSEFIEYMTSISGDYDVIVPVLSNYHEPLHAIYSTRCIVELKKLIDNNIKKISDLFNTVEVRKVSEDEIEYYDDPFKIFQNINYANDI